MVKIERRTKILRVLFFVMAFAWNACKKDPRIVEAPKPESPLEEVTTGTSPAPSGSIKSRVLTTGLNYPWEVMWGPRGKLWITERGGVISSINLKTGVKTLILKIDEVVSRGEGGMLGMARHPDFFHDKPFIYIAYNYEKSGEYKLKVVSYRWNGAVLENPKTVIDNIPSGNLHNGCRLAFDRAEQLLISTGDAGNTNNAQNKTSLAGKILRINPLTGAIPSDNPSPTSPVWSLGHRNPQGLVYASDKRKMYSSEHGANTNDEINIITKGRNYGWPNVEGNCDTPGEQTFCVSNNVAEPIYSWTPTIAPSGIEYYGKDYIGQWKGSLLMATLKNQTLYQFKLNADGTRIESVNTFLRNEYGRLRDVAVAPNGKVYVITSNGGNNDKLIEIDK